MNNLNILLYLNSKTNSNNKKSILCRLTFNRNRKQFSTGIKASPKNWDSKQQIIKPPEPDSELKNTQLSLIRTKLNQAFLFLQVRGSDFDVDDLYKQYKGETPKKEFGVMEVYNLHSDRISKLVGIEIKTVTYNKYLESGRHLNDFIKHRFKEKDIKLKTLKSSFLEHFEYYLKTEKKMQQSTLKQSHTEVQKGCEICYI